MEHYCTWKINETYLETQHASNSKYINIVILSVWHITQLENVQKSTKTSSRSRNYDLIASSNRSKEPYNTTCSVRACTKHIAN